MNSLNLKTDELNENMKKFEQLHQSLMEYETKIKYYMVKANIFSNDVYKIEREIDENKKMMEKYDEDIKDLNSKKESLNK